MLGSLFPWQILSPPVSEGTEQRNAADGDPLRPFRAQQAILFQELREEAIRVMIAASARLRKGDLDDALERLHDFLLRLAESRLDPEELSLLRRPIEMRMQQYELFKAEKELNARP
jgi:hypothetical protein